MKPALASCLSTSEKTPPTLHAVCDRPAQRKVIPLLDVNPWPRPPMPVALAPISEHGLHDTLGRPLHDLRISVTDRCNFRCTYCMPREKFGRNHAFLAQSAQLSFDEITRLATQFVALGVKKIRLTGGEPLLRKNLAVLVKRLSALQTQDGKPLDLTLTTNGSLLARQAQALRDAGLQRVTVSLDALDDAVFGRINDAGFKVADVLRGIEAAQHAGLTPIKINMVVQRGVNDSQIIPMARHFRRTGATLRFIEYMDVGGSNGWRMEQVVPSNEVLSRLAAIYPLQAVPAQTPGETATRWRYADGQGEIGLISSVSHAFCGDCNRVRLSAEGRLFTCLFAHRGHDLRTLLRDRHTDESIKDSITGIWQQRHDRYSESRGHAPLQARVTEPRVEMHYVGG